jgi:type VI secretion system protein ImpB
MPSISECKIACFEVLVNVCKVTWENIFLIASLSEFTQSHAINGRAIFASLAFLTIHKNSQQLEKRNRTVADSFQNEVPKARVDIKLDLHTGGAQKKVELPLKLLAMGDYSNGQNTQALADRNKVSIDKNNFDAVLAELNPKARIAVPNTLNGDGAELSVDLDFKSIRDFNPEQVASKVPELQALLSARNLLRDLKSNLLDNATFRRELERIIRSPSVSESLREDLQRIGESEPSRPVH